MRKEEIIRYTRVSYHDREEGREQIRIIGKWLGLNGFNAGDHIRIDLIKPGQLLITKIPKNNYIA